MLYKNYDKKYVGGSDIAALVAVGIYNDKLTSMFINFGEDGNYFAYIVDGNAEIGEHYHKVATFNYWLKLYDDDEKTFDVYAKEINLYRAGSCGFIIQIIK